MTLRLDVGLEAFDASRHRTLLDRWLRSPHVERWWGTPETHLGLSARRSPASQAVITVGGKPIGYLCWQHPTPEELKAAKLTDLPADLVDIDILIGEPDCVGCGVGPRALALLLGQFQGEGVEAAGVATSVSNSAAIRAFEKAGFSVFRDFEEPDGMYRYMVARMRRIVQPAIGVGRPTKR